MTLELYLQWGLLIAVMAAFFVFSPKAKGTRDFFKGSESRSKEPNVFVLTSGLIISWIFAKSIVNAAGLGNDYGLLGGIAYAGYYLSFLVAGYVIYQLRTKGKWTSIHAFLNDRFGRTATRIFSVLIAIRLFNEIWSNTMVIGGFFGDVGSSGYYISILVFTALTLAYVLKGGLKASLFTDVIQMLLFAVFLLVILVMVLPSFSRNSLDAEFWGVWSFDSGVNLLVLAVIQSLSYPFHDPVMTDRAFINDPKKMRKSYTIAAFIGGLCIILFSLVGVAMRVNGSELALNSFARSFGIPLLILMNLIMLTSATSTLDSAFSSFSKLWVIDIRKNATISIKSGRLAMIVLAIVGTIPVFLDPEILSATTISGTMVIGLAPIFLLWKLSAPKLSFYLSVGIGLLAGVTLIQGWIPESWYWTEGKYADYLFVNVVGSILAFITFLIPYFAVQWKSK